MDNRSLKRMLHLHLIVVEYLIVFDDVPNHLSISPILRAFPYQVTESRLLLVSRSHYDQIAVRTDYIHAMTSLDFENSWQLFLKTIFSGSNERKFPQHLVKKGMDMLKKCGGLPLAIKQIGRQIAEKRLLGGEWEQILESIDFSETMESLESSYDELDPPLKSCFLHAAFFKENKAIRPEKLMHIWARGGMVSKSTTIDCLDMLLKESIIEVECKSVCNLLKSCRINSLLHRLSMKKPEEEIGFEILMKGGGNSRASSWSPPRHRVIKCSRDEFNYSTDQDKDLVSIIFHGGGYLDTSSSYWKSAELIRILDFEDFGLKSFSVDIGKSIELRYLGLRNNYIQELPHSLDCLRRLEVLDIAHNFTVEVPDITWEMDNLTHIYMSDIICQKPLKIDRLQNLETLAYISVEKLGIEELDGNADGDWLLGSLVEFENLQQLTLRGFRFRSMPYLDELRALHELHTLRLDGLLARLPSKFPPSLKRLTSVNSYLEEDPMPVPERLRPLQCLKLRNAYTGRQMVVSDEGFQHLKFLCIQDMWNLRDVQVGDGAMKNLER